MHMIWNQHINCIEKDLKVSRCFSDIELNVFQRIIYRKLIITAVLIRLSLGCLFVYSGLYKIYDTAKFRDIISNFEILPYWIVNITAITLPWLELWIGIFLITGILVRSCTVIQICLLMVFILAIGLNIARGMEFYCGCFPADNIISGINYPHILFNIVLVFLALTLHILERRRYQNKTTIPGQNIR